MTVKPDRRDVRGIAQLLRMDSYRPAHVKTLLAQGARAMLAARNSYLAGWSMSSSESAAYCAASASRLGKWRANSATAGYNSLPKASQTWS